MLKPLTVWITKNYGKFLKRWEYQTTLAASWQNCMQVNKQQLELDIEQQTGSKLGKEYIKAAYCHPAYLTYTQSAVLCLVTQLCPALCDLMDCSLLGFSVHGDSPGKNTELVAIPSSRESSQPRDRTQDSHVAGGFFTVWATKETQSHSTYIYMYINSTYMYMHIYSTYIYIMKYCSAIKKRTKWCHLQRHGRTERVSYQVK